MPLARSQTRPGLPGAGQCPRLLCPRLLCPRLLCLWLLCLWLLYVWPIFALGTGTRAAIAADPIPDVVINEFLAANGSILADADGDYSDWIELHNAGTTPVDLGGHTITDDPGEPARWQLPPTLLPAGGHLLIWTSGKDRVNGGELHTNFRLRREGEFIGLFEPGGAVVDSLSFGPQFTDISLGRLPDGAVQTVFFLTPTPSATNTNNPYALLSCNAPAGVYDGPVMIELESSITATEIRYTTSGAPPESTSELYTGPWTLDSSLVLRARVYLDHQAVSPVLNRSYIIGENPHLPILSVATDPDNLWDDTTGIMVHYEESGDAWEREVFVSLIEAGNQLRFEIPAGIRIHGNWSRQFNKKSMRLHFRSEYGAPRLDEAIFSSKSIDSFDSLVLHAGSTDQVTGIAPWTLLRDTAAADIWPDAGGARAANRPVCLYLNGAYWGIYWLRERIDDEFLRSNYAVEDADLIESFDTVKLGDGEYWSGTREFFETHDLGDDRHYAEALANHITLDNYIDYQITNIYVANWDWPHNNTLRFHDRLGSGPWRWLLWDLDNGWASHPEIRVNHNTLAWAMRDELRHDLARGDDNEGMLRATLLLRNLVDNAQFRRAFINRFADRLNTTLGPEEVDTRIAALENLLGEEIEREVERWGGTVARWRENVGVLHDFARRRAGYMWDALLEEFELNAAHRLTLEAGAGDGEVRVNTLPPFEPARLPWSGMYFAGVPITLTATPAPGGIFVGWSNPDLPREPVITLELTGDRTLSASFAQQNHPPLAVDDQAQTPEDLAAVIAVLANDSDPDGHTLSLARFDQPDHGLVADLGDGILRYQPAPHFHGTDSFTYTISDGHGAEATATVRLLVLPVNDAPVAIDDEATATLGATIDIDVLANDSDRDGDALTVAAVSQGAQGEVVIVAGESILYTPMIGPAGLDRFTYTVSDGLGAQDVGTVEVTVHVINQPPVAVDDQATTDEDQPVVIDLLANDSDPDGDPLTITELGEAGFGIVRDQGDGRALYTPATNAHGSDRFTYSIHDGSELRASAQVEVHVASINDPPSIFALISPAPAATVEPDTVRLIWSSSRDADGEAILYTIAIDAVPFRADPLPAITLSTSLDTAIVQPDTTLLIDLGPHASTEREVAVRWSVIASDGHASTAPVEGARDFLLPLLPIPPAPAPTSLRLGPGWPNPFTPGRDTQQATFEFELPEASALRIEVFAPRGRLIRILRSGALPVGRYVVRWDGRTDAGGVAASGVYFIRLETGGHLLTRKLLLVH